MNRASSTSVPLTPYTPERGANLQGASTPIPREQGSICSPYDYNGMSGVSFRLRSLGRGRAPARSGAQEYTELGATCEPSAARVFCPLLPTSP